MTESGLHNSNNSVFISVYSDLNCAVWLSQNLKCFSLIVHSSLCFILFRLSPSRKKNKSSLKLARAAMRHSGCFQNGGSNTRMCWVCHRLWWTGCIWQEFMKALTKRWGGLRRVPCSKVGSPRLYLLLQGGHRNYDSFVRALFVDLASLISSLSHRSGQIWVKAQGNDGSTREAKWRNCKRSICCHWQNFVGHSAVCSHENMYSPLINISLFLWQPVSLANMCYNYFINFCQERQFALCPGCQTDPPDLLFSKQISGQLCSLCVCLPPSPSPPCLALALESHRHTM